MCNRRGAVGSAGSKPTTACADASKPCSDCPTKVVFKELGTNYGFDDYTNGSVPWKSVEVAKTDTVKAVITPSGKAVNVSFVSSDTGKVKVTPAIASSDEQTITVEGVANGESEVRAQCGGATLGEMKAKSYTKKTKTVAVRLVHEKNYRSTDVSDATIASFFEKVYKQAVFEFKLSRLPEKTVEFDINGDGKVNVDSWMSAEMIKIRDECKDDSYDLNLFLVDNPSDGSLGFMDFNQRYGYIHVGSCAFPEMTVAHEMGHGAFGLEHKNGDPVNVMCQGDSLSQWRLRKDQWDKINP